MPAAPIRLCVAAAWLVLAAAPPAAAQTKIGIDPAYGGTNAGPEAGGVQAKTITLAIGLKAKDWFNLDTQDASGGGSWQIFMSRETDITVTVTSRAEYFNSNNVAKVVSLGVNSFGDAAVKGTEFYHYTTSTNGQNLATDLRTHVIPAIGSTDRGLKTDNGTLFGILEETVMPAVVTMLGFISNSSDRTKMTDAAIQDATGKAILYALQTNYAIPNYDPSAAPSPGTLDGVIYDGAPGDPNPRLSGVAVAAQSGPSTTTSGSGTFSLSLEAGSWIINLSKSGYQATSKTVNITAGQTTNVTWFLVPNAAPSKGFLSGTIYDKALGMSAKIANAALTVKSGAATVATGNSDAQGAYSFELDPGTYTVNATATGYQPGSGQGTVQAGATSFANIGLDKVVADTTPPVITILQPANGAIIKTPAVEVIGDLDDATITTAKVNGASVAVANNRFQKTVTLALGPNTITVTATDAANNTGTKSVTVTYEPGNPTPDPATVKGQVYDASIGTTRPIQGAAIIVEGQQKTATSATGQYSFQMAAGTYSMQVAKAGYTTAMQGITLVAGATITLDFGLEPEITADIEEPLVTIVFPADGATMQAGKITVQADVIDNDSVATVELSHQSASGVATFPMIKTGASRYKGDATLEPGTNGIEVTAHDLSGNKGSATVVVDVPPPAVVDAGVPEPDAGLPVPDAGVSPPDAGTTEGLEGAEGVEGAEGIEGSEGIEGLEGTEGIEGTEGVEGIEGSEGPEGFPEGTEGGNTEGSEGIEGLEGAEPPEGAEGVAVTEGREGVGVDAGAGASVGDDDAGAAEGLEGEDGVEIIDDSQDGDDDDFDDDSFGDLDFGGGADGGGSPGGPAASPVTPAPVAGCACATRNTSPDAMVLLVIALSGFCFVPRRRAANAK